MRPHWPSSLPRTLASLVLVFVTLTGCGVISIHRGMGYATPPILPDTPPSVLDLAVVVTIGSPTFTTTDIYMQFYSHGSRVQFAAGETLTCNGAPPMSLEKKDGRVGLQYATSTIAGHSLACTYTSKGRSTRFQMLMPAASTILSPKDGAMLSRAHPIPITFTSATANPIIVGWDTSPDVNGAENHSDAQITAPGRGSLIASFFNPGPGTINLVEYPTIPTTPGDLHSLVVKCSSSSAIRVTWE